VEIVINEPYHDMAPEADGYLDTDELFKVHREIARELGTGDRTVWT
jgi:hypothetical protein